MAITYDNGGTGGDNTGSSGSFSYTVGTGQNAYLVVGIVINSSGAPTSVKYNSVEMTQLVAETRNSQAMVWLYGLANPSSGANNVDVTLDRSTDYHVYYASFFGVNTQSSLDTTGSDYNASSGTSTTITMTTTQDYCMLVDIRGNNRNSNNYNAGSGQTVIASLETGGIDSGFSYKLGSTSGSNSMSWNWSGNFNYSHAAIAINPLSAIDESSFFFEIM